MKTNSLHPYLARQRLIGTIAAIWLVLIALSVVWNWRQVHDSSIMFATAEARASYAKDLVYRRWVALQGGVYVPPTDASPANPYLAHIPERDLTTTSGKQLTLVNPAYMTRQVHTLGRQDYGVQGHITSLQPLNPQNSADPWEAAALQAFEIGRQEVAALETIDGESYLRFMQPLVTEKPCLKCHAAQGYKEGDIRGGISVSVPFGPYAKTSRHQLILLLFAHFLLGFLGLFGLWKGYTLLRSSDLALSKIEEKHQGILRGAMDGFWMVDPHGRLQVVNETYCRMSGYAKEELLAMHVSDLEACELPEVTGKHIDKVLTQGEDRFESQHRRKDGSIFDVEISVQYKPEMDGHLVAFLRDITELKRSKEVQKQLQNRLQQAQKMEAIGTLAGGIAHDFNNILGAILGYAEMVQEDCPPGSTMRSDIDRVVEAGHRAKELVKQILAFSRQAKTEEMVLQPAIIIKEAIKMLRASLPTTIDIEQNFDPDVGLVLADPTQIHQILTNLCTNASHAMEETGGTLTISLKNKELALVDLASEPHVQPGLFVEISVGDTGPGIAPEIMDKIFDPFFTTKEVGKGTGMGLAIIHGIAKKSGGFVSCQNSLGQGTTFHVYLPAHTVSDPPEAETTPFEIIQTGVEHILFIDDEEVLAKMGKTMLERLGYKVTLKTSSLEALTTIQNQPDEFDLVITDQTMPGMTGSDLARRILQIRPDLPIILCTGFSNLISEEKARIYGIKGFAMKPLAKKDLATLIRKVLDREKKEG